jgi:hypothetical protein
MDTRNTIKFAIAPMEDGLVDVVVVNLLLAKAYADICQRLNARRRLERSWAHSSYQAGNTNSIERMWNGENQSAA